MKKNILFKSGYLLFVTAIFISCEGKEMKKYYHDTGELLSEIEYNDKGEKDGRLREYHKNGELKAIEYYQDGELIDTTVIFDKMGKLSAKIYNDNGLKLQERYQRNGKLLSKGKMIDTILQGWWDYYDEEGKLSRKVEYINASNDSLTNNIEHPNRIISYDEEGNIVKDSSNYYTIDLKDTIPLKKVTIGYLDLVPQISKKSDLHWVYFWQEDAFGNKTKIDTTYGTNDKKAKFWVFPEKAGKIIFKGVVLEEGTEVRIDEKDTTMANIISIKKKMFFKKEIYVKDTISEN